MEEEIIIIEEPEQVVEVIEAESSEEQAVIVTHDVEIDEINHDISRTKTKTDAIWELTKGTVWEHQTDDAITSEKAITSAAKMLSINKIGGMSVKGDDELITANVESVSIESKNIFDWSKWSGIACNNAGIAVYDDDNRSMTITAQDTADAYTRFDPGNFGNWMKAKPNTKYTLSWKPTATATGRAFLFENGTTANMSSANNNVGKVTLTTTDNAEFLTIRVGAQNAGTTVKWENIQVEEGDAATEYADFSSEKIELPKAIKDFTLYGINENVYDCIDIKQKKLVRKCGAVVIDDTSTIYSFETLTNAVRMQFRIADAASGYTDCIFSNLDYLRSWDSEVTHGYMYNNTAQVIVNGITTREAALAWLHDNPVTIVYALATPTETDLTAALYLSEIEQPHLCNSGKITFNQTQAIKVDIPNEVEYAAKVKQLGYKLIADITLESATTLVTIPNINCKNVQIMVVRNGQKTANTSDEVRVNSNSAGRVAAKFARTSVATAKIMAKSFIDFEAPIRKMEYMTTYTAGGSVNFSMYYFTGLESEEQVNTLYFVATAETFDVGDEFIVYGR